MFNKTKTLEIACWSVLAALLQSCDLGTKSSPAALEDGEVVESKIADGAVTHPKLAVGAVKRVNIFTGAVDMTKIDPAINFSTTGSITGSTLNVSGASSLAAATLSGNLTVGSNKLTVDATTGNSVVAGTLNVAGAGTFGTLSTGEVATTHNGGGTFQTSVNGTVPLSVTRTDTSTGNASGAEHAAASHAYMVNLGAGTATDFYIANHGEAVLGSAQSVKQIVGVLGRSIVNIAGATAGNAIGVDSQLRLNAAATITTGIGFHASVSQWTGGSVMTTYKGLAIDDPAAGAPAGQPGTAYGVFADGATTLNYFAGKIGIGAGKTVPTVALDVNGAGSFSGALTAAGAITFTNFKTAIGGAGDAFLCVDHTTGVVSINSTCTNSDRRMKRDIKPIENALDSLLKLNGVTYFWKDSSRGPSRQIGLIAQDVEKAFPEAIKPRQDGLLGLSYESLVGPLVEGIKELYAKWSADHKLLEKQEVKLGQLEKKLEIENLALKAENKALKERLDKIEEALAAAPAQAPAKKGRKLASK